MQKESIQSFIPGRAWREQTQAMVTTLFEQGRKEISSQSQQSWQVLKNRWREFILQHTAPLRDFVGEPVRPKVLGEQVYEEFRVQKIVFESMPGWQVGLDLFLPVTGGSYQPVLCPCGHGPKWQDDHQLPPQVLARSGFAAALFDMPMFGEKIHHNDHFIQGSQANMVGMWSNLFFLVDALRVADYLETRQDIDFSGGMGITGVSGGGFATLFLAVLDPRVRVIAPVCCTAPFGGHVIKGLYTGCPENYLPGQARLGMDFDHLLCLASPLPCLVVGGTEDELFRPEQVRMAYDQAKNIYALEDVPERLDLFFDQSPHKYTLPMAQQVVRWFKCWFSKEDQPERPEEEKTVALLPREELDCGTTETTTGMLQAVERQVGLLRQSRLPRTSLGDITRILGYPQGEDLVQKDMAVLPQPDPRWGYPHLHRFTIDRKDDLQLKVWRAGFPQAPSGLFVGFTDRSKLELLRQGQGVFNLCRQVAVADLRGLGELQPDPTDYDLYHWCSIDRALSDLLYLCGETALGQQTRDALAVLNASTRDFPDEDIPVVVYGRGEAALPALFAGLLHPRPGWIVLDSFLCSFEALACHASPTWSRYQYLPDVLRSFDLPELIAAHQEKHFVLFNPLDALEERLEADAARRLYPPELAHVILELFEEPRHSPGFGAAESAVTLADRLRFIFPG